jgi:hypothetical protein
MCCDPDALLQDPVLAGTAGPGQETGRAYRDEQFPCGQCHQVSTGPFLGGGGGGRLSKPEHFAR